MAQYKFTMLVDADPATRFMKSLENALGNLNLTAEQATSVQELLPAVLVTFFRACKGSPRHEDKIAVRVKFDLSAHELLDLANKGKVHQFMNLLESFHKERYQQ